MALSRARSTVIVTSLVALACMVLAWRVDAWYGRLLHERERAELTVSTESAARTIEQEVGRRLALLTGLRAFVESYDGDRARLDREFPVFASGLLTGLSGVRALQLVHGGRIVDTWPLAGNEPALGLDLLSHPDPRVGEDVRRALRTRTLTITGPLPLVQGGVGLLARQATGLPAGTYPELANIILDVDTVLADAGIQVHLPSPAFALRDRGGELVAGAAAALPTPVEVDVRLADGRWTLESIPAGGWGASTMRERRLLRVSAAVIALLLIGVAALLAGRQARLADAVLARTRALQAANHDLQRESEERQAALLTLHERAEELRVALAAGHMGLWAWDIASGRVHWNEGVAELFGIPAESVPTTYDAYRALFAPEDRALLEERIRATLEHGTPYHIQHRVVLPDGTERWLYATAELQGTEAAGDRRLLGVIMDVTTRTRLEEQLRQAQKMDAVGTLAGGIAHDFNNLLTAILGFARLAHDSLDAPADSAAVHAAVRDDLAELISAGDRAALLTAQLLAFSRRQVVQTVAVNVDDVITEIERLLTRLLDARITLHATPSRDPVVVRADRGQLSQVLLNLVVNARDAMPDGGTIVVSTAAHQVHPGDPLVHAGLAPGAWVELRVRDEGVGMPPDVQARIFEPFFTTKPPGQGTGLGLSTAYGIVSNAGGRIVVESRTGGGTTMRVFWPALPGPVATVTPAHVPRVSTHGGETILVAEDEPGVRRLVREILERHGHVVLEAADGNDALRLLEEHGDPRIPAPIALVISDVVMPEMDGLELAGRMRERWPAVPVLLMSGYPASIAGTPDPDAPILAKPFTPGDLLTRVRALLDDAPVADSAVA